MSNYKEKLIEEVLQKEMNFKQMDAAVATIPDRYDIESTVALSAILYSHLIAFAFYDDAEAVDTVAKLLTSYSSYELSEIAKETLGQNVVEFYKEIAFANHALTEGILSKSIIESAEKMEMSYEELEELLGEAGKIIEERKPDTE